jgi:tetratricopeptide (TPR) repeat protein
MDTATQAKCAWGALISGSLRGNCRPSGAVALLLMGLLATTGFGDHPMPASGKPAVLMTGLGDVHHAVSTRNPEAQRFFDQGLALMFAFNHYEAAKSFRRAAELDPHLAMAYWGVGLALGPNINADVNPEQEKMAFEAAQKALKLANEAPEPERAYISALTKRYSDDPKADLKKLAVAYKEAMGDVVRQWPDDLDAATLYAESAMDLRPWQFWSSDGKPAEGTEELVAVLESVLRRNPHHVGANHYYIHAVEASRQPERALASAERLKTLTPAAGHLVHMPSHIYMRTGDYAEAARCNERAVAVDRAYIQARAPTGIYPMMYFSHNMHFLAVAHAMQGRYGDALKAAQQLTAHVGPHIKDMAMLEGFVPTPILIRARFRRWDEIMKSPAPEPKQAMATAMWHFARGMAQAAAGNAADAEKEREALVAARKSLPEDAMFSPRNRADAVFPMPEGLLAAKIALAKGDKEKAVELLQAAVRAEDEINYMEPSDWYLPVRETLGGLLLANGDSVEAEKVFRADLARNARSGRSLFGLRESLRRQGKNYVADLIDAEFQAAWKNADTKLRVEDL